MTTEIKQEVWFDNYTRNRHNNKVNKGEPFSPNTGLNLLVLRETNKKDKVR